jgi:hypothetical protein
VLTSCVVLLILTNIPEIQDSLELDSLDSIEVSEATELSDYLRKKHASKENMPELFYIRDCLMPQESFFSLRLSIWFSSVYMYSILTLGHLIFGSLFAVGKKSLLSFMDTPFQLLPVLNFNQNSIFVCGVLSFSNVLKISFIQSATGNPFFFISI